MRSPLLTLLCALALSACATRSSPPLPAPAVQQAGAVTLLVSIDGMRPDWLGVGDTPVLDRLATRGVRTAMRPSFPVNTFPNHYTLVTGLRPDRHGVIDNTMLDPARPGVRFQLSDARQTGDAFWWDDAEPIWVSAERAGIATATMFWPGSEAAIRGVRPSSWWPYSAAVTSTQRVDGVLDWLRRPAATRPRFATLYFDVVDKAAHNKGFDAPERVAAVREVDTAIGRLVEGLEAMGRPANILIVSDHGMAPVAPDRLIRAADLVPEGEAEVITSAPLLYAFPHAGQDAAVAARLLRPHAHARCWRGRELPARLHYGTHRRVPPFLCLAERGWAFTRWDPHGYVKGEHGFDPEDPDMRALFLAVGPAFRAGTTTPVFDNVDVYPLLRRLLGLPAATGIDGSEAVAERLLR